ncbi:MAG: hypothetical protein MZW92_77395 [Comamonadaceae bacterium]|nr:hypothetical protein [Comamonadaceae bacterium]
MGAAFAAGLADGRRRRARLMGQHALAYVLLAFLAIAACRGASSGSRLLQQALHVLPMLLVDAGADAAGRALLGGADFPGWALFLSSSLIGAPAVAAAQLPAAAAAVPAGGDAMRIGRSDEDPVGALPPRHGRPRRPSRRTTVRPAEFVDPSASCRASACAWASRRLRARGLRLLLARFVYLQVVQHDYYHTRAEDNRISLVPIVPNRGLILDRNGVVLARNYSGLHAGDHAAQGRRPGSRRSTSWPQVVDIQPQATASASASCWRKARASKACRSARA